ncbi:FAD/NAD(P)-binding domain-containing protein [Annulohypoxylon maeteangense]|uniref:FAD/NAD(P)-binding domain-containing protein n=1 Tax=Annulohypoxylon maeteangense TaxID=1927788 RepID=UPI0020080E99|nr:FAD/NAD(P)-binding domain-containing protein [Annulohypoxylon maeteangense]KAI0886477.1 FAD/NAD(P)-binding domain-containing protein [Annulohypoxylon maeteangense]
MALEYDIIIVGGGPAGLSAASSIERQGHKTVLFDSGKYRNALAKHMHTVAGWDHQDPAAFRAKARADFERYGSVTVENVEVETIKQREDGLFEATASGRTWTGKKVILATGVEDVFPAIPGYSECWVSGIFHCLFCHGWEERGQPSGGVLAEGGMNVPMALHFGRQVLRLADQATIYTHGNTQLAKELEEALAAGPAPMTVEPRKIVKLVKEPEGSKVTLHFEDGNSRTEAFIAHKPKPALRGNLHKQLGLEISPAGTIVVNPPFNQTGTKGVFAAGDCASPMHTVTQALHSGTCVGGSAPLQVQAETWHQKSLV